jgi:hypothetical protein
MFFNITVERYVVNCMVDIVYVLHLVDKNRKMSAQMKHYKEVWKAIKDTVNVSDRADPWVETLPDARGDPFSGVWYDQEDGEEEAATSNTPLVHDGDVQQGVERLMDAMDNLDKEATPRPRRAVTCNAIHGASNGDDGGPTEDAAEPEPEVPDRVPTLKKVQLFYLQLYLYLEMEFMEKKRTDNDAWIDELGETPSVTCRRYVQSGHEEVSDPDEWADIHFAANSSRARSRSRSNEEMATPISKRMPSVLSAQRDRRLAEERAEAMVAHAERSRMPWCSTSDSCIRLTTFQSSSIRR